MPLFPAPKWSAVASDRRPFRILQRQPQFLGERLAGRLRVLPGPLGLEPRVSDPAAPGRDDPPDRPEVGAIRMLLVEPPHDIRCDTDEGAERGRALDAVLAAVPCGSEHLRD